MKIVLRICFLLTVLLAGFPVESIACGDQEVQCCDTNPSQSDHHDAPCNDAACHCICCGTVTPLLSYDNLEVEAVDFVMLPTPHTYHTLFEHLFADSIWQPPKSK